MCRQESIPEMLQNKKTGFDQDICLKKQQIKL